VIQGAGLAYHARARSAISSAHYELTMGKEARVLPARIDPWLVSMSNEAGLTLHTEVHPTLGSRCKVS